MEKLILFLKIIAWATAICSTILTSLSIWGALIYPGSIEETMDKIKGRRTEYQVFKWFAVAVISWAFIIAF